MVTSPASSASSVPTILPTIVSPAEENEPASKKRRGDEPIEVQATFVPLPLDETEKPVPPEPSDEERLPSPSLPLKAKTNSSKETFSKPSPARDGPARVLPQELQAASLSSIQAEPSRRTGDRSHGSEMAGDLERLRKFRRKKNCREARRKERKRAQTAAARSS